MKKTAILLSVFFFLTTLALPAPRYVETIRNANIRAGAATNSALVATSEKGDIFQLIKETDKWYIVQMFSGEDRYIYKTLARKSAYTPSLPETIEQRRNIFREWNDAEASAQADADRRYPPEKNLKGNLAYLHLQIDKKKLDLAHKYNLQPPDLRRIVLEGNFKGW